MDDLLQLFKVGNGQEIEWHLHLHSAIPEVEQACEWLVKMYPNIRYFPHKTNRGLARSWNDSLEMAYAEGSPVALVINDDVLPKPGDIQRVAQLAIEQPKHALVKCVGHDYGESAWRNMEWTFTAVTRRGIERVGYFDENIHPIYFEDTDWQHRALKMGEKIAVCNTTDVIHAGSKTRHTVPELQETMGDLFDANRDYYFAKWGGVPAVYPTPFNDPRYSLMISAEARHNPYPYHPRRKAA